MRSWPRLFLLGLGLLVPAAARAQVPPEKALSTFTVADGLELSLWASEPLFVNPTCIDIDHKGRVWVCESVNYRNKLHRRPKLNRPEGDRIVILEDTKGTGKADKAITFYQSPDFIAPLGIAVAKDPTGPGYKVFVCHSPDILVFEDNDGDGKADGPPKKLLSGFGGYDHDHGVHGILIGPDGKLYFSVGDTGVHGLQSSDGKGRKWTSNSTDCRAGTIWRCDLDGKNLELLAHNFRNEYEPCVDSFGAVFVSDNDDDGNQQTRICYVMPGGNYGYHPRGPGQTHWHEEQPGVVPKILRTYFGSPTGMCVYEGTLLPKKYQGQLLHTDAGPRHLRCYHLKPRGAGYEVEREDMVTSTDNWFRPSDVCVAPDGSVFIADWYDPGVGGHGMGDTTRGRIYRLAPKGSRYSVPKVDLETNKGVVAALGSPNRAVRYMAIQKIRSLDGDQVTQVSTVALARKNMPWLQARMLWLLPHRQSDDWLIGIATDSPLHSAGYEHFNLLGIRQLSSRYPDLAKAPQVVRQQLREDALRASTPVRREILLALRSTDPTFAREIILPLASKYDGKDRFYLEAIGIAIGHHDQKRREIILADFQKHFPEWNPKVADLVWELRPPSVMPLLEKRLVDGKIPAADRARVVDILAISDDKNAGRTLLKVLRADVPPEVRDKVFENLKLFLPGKWRDLRQSPELTQTIQSLLARPETRTAALALIGVAGRVADVGSVVDLARSDKEPAAVRQAAVRTLGMLPSKESVPALQFVLRNGPATLNASAVQALGELAGQKPDVPGSSEALRALQYLVRDEKGNLATRLAALSALAGTRPGTIWLLDLHARGELADSLKGDTARLLRNSPHQDLRNRALIAFPPAARMDPKKLPSIATLVTRKGDPDRGARLLAESARNDMQCLKCHTVRGTGGQIGPDLSAIGTKASKENLYESILYPSKAVADQFINWQIETKKGLSLGGLIVEETPAAVTLRDGNGKDTRIDKKDIESRAKSPKSLMPEDLVLSMTEDDLIDLVEYLLTLKSPTPGMN